MYRRKVIIHSVIGPGSNPGYELTRDIPDRLKDPLPVPEELEKKILFELGLDEDFSGK